MRHESEAVEGYERPTPKPSPKLKVYAMLTTVAFLAALLAAAYPCPGGISQY